MSGSPDTIDRELDQFLELWLADTDLLRTEFDAIIAAMPAERVARPPRRVPAGADQPGRRSSPGRSAATTGEPGATIVAPCAEDRGRERSPPRPRTTKPVPDSSTMRG